MEINLQELQHIAVSLKQFKGTLTDEKFKDDINNLFLNISKFLVDEKKKVKIDINVKGENNDKTIRNK